MRKDFEFFLAKVIAGEPCALKDARTVRRGIIGNTLIIYSTWLVAGSTPAGPIFIVRSLAPTLLSLGSSLLVLASDVLWQSPPGQLE